MKTARGPIARLEVGAGWPVVLLHAFPLRADMWRPYISCSTIVIVGERDEITPVADAEAMPRAIARSTLSVIPGAGHLSNPRTAGGVLPRPLGLPPRAAVTAL